MTTITIPKKIENELKEVSRNLGLSKEDFLANAVLFYLKTIRDEIELKKELEIWERVTDEDLLKFEKSL